MVTPKQRFLDWLHAADPTSGEVDLENIRREPNINLQSAITKNRPKRTFESFAVEFLRLNWTVGTGIDQLAAQE